MSGTVQGERFHAEYYWDDRDPANVGWYIEYLTEHGDCVDDSIKIWHPPIDRIPPADEQTIRVIAATYLAKLEGGTK